LYKQKRTQQMYITLYM